jgi:DNA-binding CsgD family transcriptional regulator
MKAVRTAGVLGCGTADKGTVPGVDGSAGNGLPGMAWGGQQPVWLGHRGSGTGQKASNDFSAALRTGLAMAMENADMPVIWCDRLMSGTIACGMGCGREALKINTLNWRYEDAQIYGIWAFSDLSGATQPGGMEAGPRKLRWLVQMTHVAFSRLVQDQAAAKSLGLTERELEVMKWTADGKSAQDVADILRVSRHTVEFHIKNSVAKLQAPNKTAAVVRAALLGLLS